MLANDTLRLELAHDTGAVVGLTADKTGRRILDRPHLGLSFRLMVPIRGMGDWHTGGRRTDQVLGEAGAGLWAYGDAVSFGWPYPYLLAGPGALDLAGLKGVEADVLVHSDAATVELLFTVAASAGDRPATAPTTPRSSGCRSSRAP